MKKLSLVLVLVLVLSLFAGCSNNNDPATTTGKVSAEDDLIEVAYVSGELTNEIFAMQVEAMEALSLIHI